MKSQGWSALATFITSFVVVLGIQLTSGVPIEWNTTFWFTTLMVAVRGAIKAVFETILSKKI